MSEPHEQHKKPADTPKPVLGFAAGTPIRTPEGSKLIEDVKPGDLIQSQPDDAPSDHEPEDHEDDHAGDDTRWWEWN